MESRNTPEINNTTEKSNTENPTKSEEQTLDEQKTIEEKKADETKIEEKSNIEEQKPTEDIKAEKTTEHPTTEEHKEDSTKDVQSTVDALPVDQKPDVQKPTDETKAEDQKTTEETKTHETKIEEQQSNVEEQKQTEEAKAEESTEKSTTDVQKEDAKTDDQSTQDALPVDQKSEVQKPNEDIKTEKTTEQPTTDDHKEDEKKDDPKPKDAQSTQDVESKEDIVDIEFVVKTSNVENINRVQLKSDLCASAVYDYVAKEYNVNIDKIKLNINGSEFDKDKQLKEFCSEHSKTLKLDLEIDVLPEDLKPSKQTVSGTESKTIDVEIYYGEGVPSKTIRVTVLKLLTKKPFLGGYRNKETRVEYHHASCQTDPIPTKKKKEERKLKFHRETQTIKVASTSQQTTREQGTQMAKPGLYIDDTNDKIIIPHGQYFDADQWEALRLEKTIIIQSFVRGWFARKLANQRRKEKEMEEKRKKEEEAQRLAEEAERKEKEKQRRMHPRTPKDFEILYSDLERWRQKEIEKVKKLARNYTEKRAGLLEILRKETKLLQTLDRLKKAAALENKHDKINDKLEKMAKPKIIKHADGKITQVETPFTVRARELMDLYHGLNTPMLSVDERLDVLLHVKWTVKEFNCQLTRDIVELIDREGDLLHRGRKDSSLAGLRKRLSNLFLRFIETPEFNPEALAFQRVPLEYAINHRPDVQLFSK